VVFGQVIK
nr:CyP-40=40-kDa cyclophilin-related protein [cattle, brain, Peptide Partial, 8 aa] [Bos taurus]